MRLFHFSDDDGIETFDPRPVIVPSERSAGREWLNGPLIWAIDEARQPMYLFPRECPRILLWQTSQATEEDRAAWWGQSTCRVIVCVEWTWLEQILAGRLYRYELPSAPFEDLHDAGMWVSRTAVRPLQMTLIDDLPGALRALDVELRLMLVLTPLKGVWRTTIHASGIRLRNAKQWD